MSADMPRFRPAWEIEPVLAIASSGRILLGPDAWPRPKSTLRVSLFSARRSVEDAVKGPRLGKAIDFRSLRLPC
jgi:hypothetical protein